MVSKDCQLRITDFGLARYMDDETLKGNNDSNPQTEYVVTRWYRCPELLLSPNRPYSTAIDIWSVGCIMAELIRRKPLFPGKSHANQVQLIFEVLGYSHPSELGFPISAEATSFLNKRCKSAGQDLWDVIPEASEEAVCFIAAMLDVNPKHRPTASQALDLPYMMDADIVCDYSNAYCEPPAPGMFKFERQKLSTDELKELIHMEVFSTTPGGDVQNEEVEEAQIDEESVDFKPDAMEPRPVSTTALKQSENVESKTSEVAATNQPVPVATTKQTDEIEPKAKSSSSNIFAVLGAAAINAVSGERKVTPRTAANANGIESTPRSQDTVTTNATTTQQAAAAKSTETSVDASANATQEGNRAHKSEVTFAEDTFSCKYSGPLAANQSMAEEPTIAKTQQQHSAANSHRSVPLIPSHSEKGIVLVPDPDLQDFKSMPRRDAKVMMMQSSDPSRTAAQGQSAFITKENFSTHIKETEQETTTATVAAKEGWFPKKQTQQPSSRPQSQQTDVSATDRRKSKGDSMTDERNSLTFMQSLRSKLTTTTRGSSQATAAVPIEREFVASTETDTIPQSQSSQRNTLPLLRPLSSMFSSLNLTSSSKQHGTGSSSARKGYVESQSDRDTSHRTTHNTSHHAPRTGPGNDEDMLPYVKELTDHNPDQSSSAIDTDHHTQFGRVNSSISVSEKKHSTTELPRLPISSSVIGAFGPSSSPRLDPVPEQDMVIADITHRSSQSNHKDDNHHTHVAMPEIRKSNEQLALSADGRRSSESAMHEFNRSTSGLSSKSPLTSVSAREGMFSSPGHTTTSSKSHHTSHERSHSAGLEATEHLPSIVSR